MPRVVYFSLIREKIGKSEEEIELSGTIGDLRKLLENRYPDLKSLIGRIKFAVNEEYVDDSYKLSGDERVAVIPPVSGGL